MSLAAGLILGLLAAPWRGGLIVGVNEPFEDSQVVLQYADDDAARYHELLGPGLDDAELLTVLDAPSQALFPGAAAVSRPPDRPTFDAALDRLEAKAERARAAGQRTELWLIYVGHGRAPGGEGEVRLLGGALDRRTLSARLQRARAFDRIHLVVDACNAYHLVHERGGADAEVASFEAAFTAFVEAPTLAEDPRTGVVLATRGAGTTPEWSRYQAGVFSHGVRSALTGAADANLDGAIGYRELEAFLAAAHLEIPEPKGRPRILVRPPQLEVGATFWSPPPHLLAVELAPPPLGPCFLEDERGVRVADFNAAPGTKLHLQLLRRSRYDLYDRGGARLAHFAGDGPAVALNGPYSPGPLARLWRGEEEPDGAFQVPYGPDFVAGFEARAQAEVGKEADEGPPVRLIAALSTAGAALALGGGCWWQAHRADEAYGRYRAAYDEGPRDQAAGEVESARTWSWGLGLSAAALMAVSVGLFTFELTD